MNPQATPYDDLIRSSLPRVLSQLSRDPDNPTYGCFDRNYWHLKVRDFPSMVLQASALTLALVVRDRLGLVPNDARPMLAEWARAGCRFWAKRQHRNGFFDEYYPRERALIPTSFTTFAVSRAYTVEDASENESAEREVLDALRKAAHAIAGRSEALALNQEAASLPSLLAVARLTDDDRLRKAAVRKLDRFLGLQKGEGWFDERGGLDVGYLSTTLDYLCEAHRLLPRDDLLDAARRVAELLQYFLHPDGTCGGQYGSRNTEYLIPAGFEYLAREHEPSAAVCAWLYDSVLSRRDSFYDAFDDRYMCHNMLHAALRAREYYLRRRSDASAPPAPASVPSAGPHEKYLPEAGLWVSGDGHNQVIAALKKGGVIHAVCPGGRVLNDYGFRCGSTKGRFMVSNWQSDAWRVKPVQNGYRVSGPLCRAKFVRNTPLRHVVLRVLAKLVGPRLIPILQRRLILHNTPTPTTLSRTITRTGNELRVVDTLESPEPLHEVWEAPKYSLRHVASSMYFREEEILGVPTGRVRLRIESKNGKWVARRTRVWNLATGEESPAHE